MTEALSTACSILQQASQHLHTQPLLPFPLPDHPLLLSRSVCFLSFNFSVLSPTYISSMTSNFSVLSSCPTAPSYLECQHRRRTICCLSEPGLNPWDRESVCPNTGQESNGSLSSQLS